MGFFGNNSLRLIQYNYMNFPLKIVFLIMSTFRDIITLQNRNTVQFLLLLSFALRTKDK